MIFANQIKTELRQELLSIASEAVVQVQPRSVIPKMVRFENEILFVQDKEYGIKNKRIFVIGIGKIAAEMALEIENILTPDRITAGLVVTKYTEVALQKIVVRLADHPTPSQKGKEAMEEMFALKDKYKINNNDSVIALVSGGGSSLGAYPVDTISIEDKQKLYQAFIKHGVAGKDSTVIKSKISRVKGGALAEHFYPAQIVSLVISDDNGQSGDENTASGPFVPHQSTFQDALRLIAKYKMRDSVPESVVNYLEENIHTTGSKNSFSHVDQFILASNNDLVDWISNYANNKNWNTMVKKNVHGEAREVAEDFCEYIRNNKFEEPTLLLWGGETTVTLSKSFGVGGRSQEFVATCLRYIRDYDSKKEWVLAGMATDGVDHVLGSAGGIIDAGTIKTIKERGIDVDVFLDNHDTYNLLRSIDSNITTNVPTETNVVDLMMYLQV